MKRFVCFAALAAIVLAGLVDVEAEAGVMSIRTTADTELRSYNATTNYGTKTEMGVGYHLDKDLKNSLVGGFDLSLIPIPAGEYVVSARLRLRPRGAQSWMWNDVDGGGIPVSVYRMRESWVETGWNKSTWSWRRQSGTYVDPWNGVDNSQPGDHVHRDAVASDTNILPTAPTSAWQNWDVTADVIDMYAGGDNFGWLIEYDGTPPNGEVVMFKTREFGTGGGRAMLEVTTALPGDFDVDGDVDGGDFLTWQRGFGTTYNASDLADWETNFGAGSNPLLDAVSAVPEPSSSLLLVLAGASACCTVFRRRDCRRNGTR